MKSKSIVQERLDAGKNRLDIISREIESSRMSTKDVSNGLRQVGAMLESAQKFVKTDTNVKFATQIEQKLESSMKYLSGTIKALDGEGITNKNLGANLTQVGRIIESVQEFVDLEIETLG